MWNLDRNVAVAAEPGKLAGDLKAPVPAQSAVTRSLTNPESRAGMSSVHNVVVP